MNIRMKHAKRAQKYKEIELTLFLSPTSAICLV